MTNTRSVQIELLLGELKEVLRLEPNHVAALCRIGGRLAAAGQARETGKCYRAALKNRSPDSTMTHCVMRSCFFMTPSMEARLGRGNGSRPAE